VYRETHARQIILRNFGARRDILSPVTFAEQLPADVPQQQRSRGHGDPATVLAYCP
jgi:hypothetical protein